MIEGWGEDDYLILFEEGEIEVVSTRYDIAKVLPGYRVLGLKGWDDFIVSDKAGNVFTIPTLPLDSLCINQANPKVDGS